MTYKVNSADSYSLAFGQSKEQLSVLQNIALLLNTKCGTAPMYREFGLPMKFVDKPLEVAETIAFSEISEAFALFEPRAELKNLYIEKDKNGKMSITVEVEIKDEGSRA